MFANTIYNCALAAVLYRMAICNAPHINMTTHITHGNVTVHSNVTVYSKYNAPETV